MRVCELRHAFACRTVCGVVGEGCYWAVRLWVSPHETGALHANLLRAHR